MNCVCPARVRRIKKSADTEKTPRIQFSDGGSIGAVIEERGAGRCRADACAGARVFISAFTACGHR